MNATRESNGRVSISDTPIEELQEGKVKTSTTGGIKPTCWICSEASRRRSYILFSNYSTCIPAFIARMLILHLVNTLGFDRCLMANDYWIQKAEEGI